MNNNLFGKTLEELKIIVQQHNLPSFNAKQIADWLYKKQVESIDEMTNLSKIAREKLKENYTILRVKPSYEVLSVDGTKKYLFRTKNGNVETVFIPEEDRATVCVSSQVGCKMHCKFCMTGKQGFSGNLTADEILNQLFSLPDAHKLTNMVLMGMGEPFDNFDEVIKALAILTSDWGFAWSPRRITVSTVGLVSGIKRFLSESECHLAISLHHPFPEEREKIMPIEKAFSTEKILYELKKNPIKGQRRLSFEYIVFDSLNDTMRHARELTKLLNGIDCRVNLIKFHSTPDSEFKSPSQEKMEQFRNYLNENNIICTIRRSRGEDISAACGLLSTKGKN